MSLCATYPENGSRDQTTLNVPKHIVSFVTLSLLAKNFVSITKIVNFGPLGPFSPF